MKPFNHRGIRKLASYLASTHYRLQLLVPEYNFVTFHRRLTAAKTNHKIVLLAISTSKDTSSSSDGGQPGLIRKDYDDYEIPVQVERSLRAVKRTLMKPYIDSGQVKLKRQRISNPSYIDILIKRNIVNKSCVYRLLDDKVAPPLALSCLITKPVNIDSISDAITSTCSKFIESIIYFEDDWVFVTQLDAFVRNDPDIDPCALDTKLVGYPETPVAKVLSKSYKRSTWNEVVILYGRFEFLVTGGIYSNTKDHHLRSFLGSSFKIKSTIDEDCKTSIYILGSPCDIHKEERLLQNYSRRAANYKWGLRSKRFMVKGFGTLNPLYTNITPLERAGSLVLKCLAYNEFTENDRELMLNHIYEATASYSISIDRGTDDIMFLNSLQPLCNTKFKVIISAAIKLINGSKRSHKPQTVVDGTLATSVFKDVVSYRCNVVHNSKVSNETFLV
jgi:hypothetical protein